MAKRRTKTETLKAEDQALRLHARGLTFRDIGQALQLSASEARRKVKLALERRRGEAGETDAWAETDAALVELLRTSYRDHDAAPPGSAAQIGALKLIRDLVVLRARLDGMELKRANVAALNSPAGGAKEGNDAENRTFIAANSPEMKEAVASALEAHNRDMDRLLGGGTVTEAAIRGFGSENISPARPDTAAILTDEEDFGDSGEDDAQGNAEETSS